MFLENFKLGILWKKILLGSFEKNLFSWEIFWKFSWEFWRKIFCLGNFWKFLGNFGKKNFVWEIFENFLGILKKIYWECFAISLKNFYERVPLNVMTWSLSQYDFKVIILVALPLVLTSKFYWGWFLWNLFEGFPIVMFIFWKLPWTMDEVTRRKKRCWHLRLSSCGYKASGLTVVFVLLILEAKTSLAVRLLGPFLWTNVFPLVR